ncbi:MAG: hypothetical protein ACRDPL_17540, partial [Propionibacteriaceae bacterium]
QRTQRASVIAPRRAEPGWRSAVLGGERAETLFVASERRRQRLPTDSLSERREQCDEAGADGSVPPRATTKSADPKRDARAAQKEVSNA